MTNDLKKNLYDSKDATDDDFEKKMIDPWALYHDRWYLIQKDRDVRPPLKLCIGEHVMVANVSQDGTNMKITFTLIHNFASLFTVEAV